MTSSLDAALSGLLEQQRSLELIANNLANVNTTGYKRAQVHFQDVLDTAQILAALRGELPPADASTSAGVQSSTLRRTFTQGPITPTQRELDFAIEGDGFFRLALPDGSFGYTRDGTLQLGADGRVTSAHGYPLEPPITLPPVYRDLRVESDGSITVRRPLTEAELAGLRPDQPRDGVRENVGTLQLVRFANTDGLSALGENLFAETAESQAPIEGQPGIDGMGFVRSGFLEASNVDVAEEMTAMTLASRSYQLNLTAYRTIDEMLRAAGQLP